MLPLLPAEIYHAITRCIVDSNRYSSVFFSHRYDSDTWQTLANLRLVNRTFCRTASPFLFRYIDVLWNAEADEASPLVSVFKISNTHLATYVQQIRLYMDRKTSGEAVQDDETKDQDPTEFFCACLTRLPNLHLIELSGMGFLTPQTDLLVRMVTMMLRSVSLPNLKDLGLEFPIALDFRALVEDTGASQISIDQVMRRLRTLRLKTFLYTSHRGEPLWRRQRLVDVDRTAAMPEAYALHILKFIQWAEHLEHLAISSTDLLNLDNMTFSSSLRLKTIHLRRVVISSEPLINLVRQGKESLGYIDLAFVELNSGTWEDVLLEISTLSGLYDLAANRNRYSKAGTSKHFRTVEAIDENGGRRRDEFLTLHKPDYTALGKVERRVNANRAAMGLWLNDYETEETEEPVR